MTMPMFEGRERPTVREYLRQQYGEQQVTMHGMRGTFAQVLDAEELFCPVPAEQQNQGKALEYLGDMLEDVLSAEDRQRIEELKRSQGD